MHCEYFFTQNITELYITSYIRNLADANTDPEALQVDSEQVLHSIEAQHSLLVERAKKIYSFRSTQEVLPCQFLAGCLPQE